MWIIEWSNLTDYEFGVTAWASEEEALKSSCTQIVNRIKELDNYTSSSDGDELHNIAEIVNEMIIDKRYKQAIESWNKSTFNNDSINPMTWTVRYLTTQRYYGKVATLDKEFFGKEDEETTMPGVIVNNHTCTICGNTKCSKQEASCWSCGNPI